MAQRRTNTGKPNKYSTRLYKDSIVGKKFGKLIIMARLSDTKSNGHTVARVLVQCACGKRKIVRRQYFLGANTPKSCGYCNASRIPQKIAVSIHPEYKIWKQIIGRTTNPKHHAYKSYGAAGILMEPDWLNSFDEFLAYVGYRPTPMHTLDRKNVHQGYFPGNVEWATPKEQARNKKDTKWVQHPTTKQPIRAAELAEELNITYQELRTQLVEQGKW